MGRMAALSCKIFVERSDLSGEHLEQMMEKKQSIFYNKRYISLITSCLIFSFVHFFLLAALPLYLLEAGTSIQHIGIIVGIYGISAAIFRMFFGGIIDNLKSNFLLRISAIILAVSFVLYLILPPGLLLIIPRLLQGVSIAIFFTTAFAWCARELPQETKGLAMGVLSGISGIGLAFAPSIGLALQSIDMFYLFLTCLIGAILLLFLAVEQNYVNDMQDNQVNGLKVLQLILIPASVVIMVNLPTGTLQTFFPILAQMRSVDNLYPIFIGFGMMLVVGRGYGGKLSDKFGRKKIIISGLALILVASFILLVIDGFWGLFFSGLLLGMGFGFTGTAASALASDLLPENKQGKGLGYIGLAGDISITVGSAIGGFGLMISPQFISYLIIFISLIIFVILLLSQMSSSKS